MKVLWIICALSLLSLSTWLSWIFVPSNSNLLSVYRRNVSPLPWKHANHPKPHEKIDQEEYDRFMESLYSTQEARQRFFDRLNRIRPPIDNKQHNGPNPQADANIDDINFRKFDYQTGVQFEEEFDCDLSWLHRCESLMIKKVEAINMGTLTENEVLNVCQSIDDEFTCLLDFAEKCEQKTNQETFIILKYVIENNNSTIVSCRAKEKDWIGFGFDSKADEDDSEEWVDSNGVWHYYNRHQYHTLPCITAQSVYSCMIDSFGIHFDPSLDMIETRSQCDCLAKFDRCLKKWIFESSELQLNKTSKCLMEEKETTLDILRDMFQFNLPEDNVQVQEQDVVACKAMRDHWHQSNYAKEQKLLRENDNAAKLTDSLRSTFQMLKQSDCQTKTIVDDELCMERFEKRVRHLLTEQKSNSWKSEVEQMCCYTSELTACISTFVLIRCGVQQFNLYQDRVEFSRLNSLPDECASLPYAKCQTLLHD